MAEANYVNKIVKWGVYGAVAAFIVDWLCSSGQVFSIRLCFGVMCAGGGFVTVGLLAAVFLHREEDDDSHPQSARPPETSAGSSAPMHSHD